MKKVLVCGADGFIGKNIYEMLKRRNDLVVFGTCWDKDIADGKSLLRVDLRDKHRANALMADKDCVIHSAAVTGGSTATSVQQGDFVPENTRINTNLIEAAHQNKVRHFVFLSCAVMYPSSSRPLKEEEADLNNLHPHYVMGAWLKVFFERMCQYYSAKGSTKFTIVRPSSIYGPYDKFNEQGHILDSTMPKIIAGENVALQSTGQATRDFLYVDDLARFIEAAIDCEDDYKFEIFNVASGHSVSIRGLLEKMVAIARKEVAISYGLGIGIETHTSLDITKAFRNFGWKPEVSLEEGIKKTMRWYIDNNDNDLRPKGELDV